MTTPSLAELRKLGAPREESESPSALAKRFAAYYTARIAAMPHLLELAEACWELHLSAAEMVELRKSPTTRHELAYKRWLTALFAVRP